MAIFERSSQTATALDDTEKFTCTIENAQNINKHTEYILRVQRGPNKENKWNVSRRYRDFAALQASIQQANIALPLPPKKLIGNMHPSFIAERQIALQAYINDVLKHPVLALSLQVRSFLDPNNYSLAIAEQALQTVSIALRGEGRFELKGPLADIGWRIRKHYFMVTDTENQTNCMLSWQNYGPDRFLNDKDLQTAFKSLLNLSHPYIDQILAIHNLETGAYVVRRVHENGTVRDMLYGTEYSKNHLAKYGNPKVKKPFTYGQIAHYGYQILLALKFLHEKGLAHGHLHPGNIAIVNQTAQLLDIENIFLGAPCLYRPFLLELRRVSGPEVVDVYCFGRTLYEMACAAPLEEYYCDYYPCGIDVDLDVCDNWAMCDELIKPLITRVLDASSLRGTSRCFNKIQKCRYFAQAACRPIDITNGYFAVEFVACVVFLPESVLRLCISSTTCKHGSTTIDHLLLHPLFSRAALNGFDDPRGHLKFPLALKGQLKGALDAAEARLKSEQKLMRSVRREVRIQEILNSEEELKKAKRRAKKRESIWKSTSSLGEGAPSHSASTASSPTPPVIPAETNGNSSHSNNGAISPASPPPAPLAPAVPSTAPVRSALLNAICSFDKSRLARVDSR